MAKLSGARHASLFAENKMRVSAILTNGDIKAREKQIRVYDFILRQEIESGSNFVVTKPDMNVYVILGLTKRAIALPKHGRGCDEFFAYLTARYGLSERENITKFVYDNIRLYAYQQGREAELRRFSYYDRDRKQLYLSLYNGQAIRIDGEQPHIVDNGVGVYFADDDGGTACEHIPFNGSDGLLFESLTDLSYAEDTPSGIKPIVQKRALIVWMFALAFPDLMPTKPLIIFEGPPGSGKSSASQIIQLALMGNKKPIILQKNKENDFGIILLRNPIAVFDNVDSFIEWVPDAVCAYATSGMWTMRRLYTDNEEVTIRPHSFIAIASKNPASFRREDTAERCVIIRLQRLATWRSQESIEQFIRENRGRLLGEYFYYLNLMVAAIRDGVLDENGESPGEQHRMADFAAMARVVGHVLGWTREDVAELLEALQMERDAFINEEDPLVDLIHMWLDIKDPPYQGRPARSRNQGRAITTQDLFRELEAIAIENKRQFYKSSRVLAQKLRSPHLERDFSVIVSSARNTRLYQFAKKLPLSIVPAIVHAKSVDAPSTEEEDDLIIEDDDKKENGTKS
jgi:hypothetical protein